VAAIRVAGLRKTYGEVEAVAGLDFEVAEGECFALLGPNGAGKTTTVEILEGYRRRSAGEVEVLGFDPERGERSFRERIGIVLQSAGIDRELTVEEIVGLFGGYYPHPRDVGDVVDLVGLGEKRTARVKTLSGGQQRRLDLALGIVGDPDLIFLDEPTTGFDPSARRRSWELVDSLRDLGKTILLTTHYMDEAQNLADRVAIMAGGRIVAEGDPESLGGRDVAEAVVSFRLPDGARLADLPGDLPDGLRQEEDLVLLRTTAPTRALHTLTGWALARGEELEALAVTRPSLEDVYLRLTGAMHE
jgi:ABC-2 type transport system ATP-binding protein